MGLFVALVAHETEPHVAGVECAASAEEPTPVELTDSAAALWRLLPAASVGELAERVGVDFSVPVDAVIADVENYVASMLDQGFVEVA